MVDPTLWTKADEFLRGLETVARGRVVEDRHVRLGVGAHRAQRVVLGTVEVGSLRPRRGIARVRGVYDAQRQESRRRAGASPWRLSAASIISGRSFDFGIEQRSRLGRGARGELDLRS